VLYNSSVYKNEAGEVQGVFAAARDITERKRSERQLADLHRQHKLVLEAAAEGILGLDSNGTHAFVNPVGSFAPILREPHSPRTFYGIRGILRASSGARRSPASRFISPRTSAEASTTTSRPGM
jgi:hypothetical protein